jgi:hypothetical protein
MPRVSLIAAALSAGLFACQPPVAASLENDVVALAADDGARRSALDGADPGERLVYVHFDGITLTRGRDWPARSSSAIVPGDVVVPPFDASRFSLPPSEVRARIVERVKQHYARFRVKVVTTRPDPALDYSMCVVGGHSSLLGLPSSVAGIAPLDCDDARGGNVVFAFSDELTPDQLRSEARAIAALAVACSHELGHSFGLGHTTNDSDIMAPIISDDTNAFAGPSPVTGGRDPQCVDGATQDGRALLAETIGKAIVDDEAPLAIVGARANAGSSTVTVHLSSAVPGHFVEAIDLFADGAQVGTLSRPPLRLDLAGLAGGRSVTLKAIARDRNGTVAESRLVTFDPATVSSSIECRVHADCAASDACVNGRCTLAVASPPPPPPPPVDGAAATPNASAGGTRPPASAPIAGCSIADHARASTSGIAILFAFALFACVRRLSRKVFVISRR